MDPVRKILGKNTEDYCPLCGLKVGKENVYGISGCSECADLNED